jgi:tRNA nucleotidyltransferase (CCA-adding enzyme)
MEIYLVGGAVRDALMGLPVQDRDWVVVGATPEQMVALGYKPVGRDFPVFLHPVTKEEYALARTERKTAPGYRGFVVHAEPQVTLEQDLARRDITINAMAQTAAGERLIDPFSGQADLQAKVLRHVTPAFREDPVRILRVARFSARFPDFSVAPQTRQLMRDMVASAEVDALVPERVWQELSNGLMTPKPSRMMGVLADTGALSRLLPPMRQTADPHFVLLDRAADAGAQLAVRFALLMSHFESDPAFLRRVPASCSELALLFAREEANIAKGPHAPDDLVSLLERCDAFRKPARFADLLQCCRLLKPMDDRRLLGGLHAAQAVKAAAALATVAGKAAHGPHIAAALRAARVAAVAAFLANEPVVGAAGCPAVGPAIPRIDKP